MIRGLEQIGLKEKEIKVYLAILKLGASPAQSIAAETTIKRTTVYLVLEKLKQIGLIGEIIDKNKKAFFAEKPEKLLKIIREKKRNIEKEEERVKEILPQLEKILKNKNISSSEEICHYQGKEGIWNIVENYLKSRKDLYIFFPGKTYEHLGLPRILTDVTKKRRQIGKTKAYIITDYHTQNKKFFHEEDTDFREIRFLPEISSFDSGILIYDQKIALVSLQEPYSSILIKNPEIYFLVKFMFDIIWRSLEGKNLPTPESVSTKE